MTFRVLAFAAPLLASATAFAQAPGEAAPEYAAPPPPPADPCVVTTINPMAQRFSIGLGIGAFAVAPEGAPEGSETRFRNTELALRYRATYRLELELNLFGGRQAIEGPDGDERGELANGGGLLSARYRFRPQQRWNWWLSGGLGVAMIAHHSSDEQARQAATRPAAALGIGIERRFRRFALQAELKSFALGPRKDQEDGVKNVPTSPPMSGGGAPGSPEDPSGGGGDMPPPPDVNPLPPAVYGEPEELKGASFSINLSYYF